MAGLSSDFTPSFSTMLLDKHKSRDFWYETKCPRCGSDDVAEKEVDHTAYMICEKCGYMQKKKKA